MKKVIFLDRDGTINVDHGYVHAPEQWDFIPHVPEALKMLQDAGYALAVATNQSGVGNGLYTAEEVGALHEHMQSLLKKYDVSIDAIAYCPHIPAEKCDCRKPEPGMFDELETKLGEVDYKNSWMIGDKFSDIEFGQHKSLRTVLLKSKYWSEVDLVSLVLQPTYIADDLMDAARHIASV